MKHPTYAVFAKDRFTLINASHSTPQHLRFNTLKPSLLSPTFVYSKMPDNKEQRTDLMFGVVLSNGPIFEQRAEFYEPFEIHADTILAKSIKIEQFVFDAYSKEKLVRLVPEHGGTPSDYAFFPLRGNNKREMIWGFDRKNMKPMGVIDLDPSIFITKKT